ncbi:MAG: metallophosphoesterase [Chloroflexota bacterium]
MPISLTKTFPRLWSLDAGLAMVVADLHGDGEAYRRYRDRFVDLQAGGRADYLIFTGDLIHREDEGLDQSVEIVRDVLALQASYGQAIIYLCGNHELPHLYNISLAKGNRVFTPTFELAMKQQQCRAEVIALFDRLPFYLRTRAGVALAHAGAAPSLVESETAQRLFHWDHQQLLQWADEILTAEDIEILRLSYARVHRGPYDLLARYQLAVSGPDDPRYDDLLRGFVASSHPAFDKVLWPALFTRCEHEYGKTDYAIFLNAMLQELSGDFQPQEFLIAGHITIKGGYQVVADRHLRLASAYHATPREAGQYVLFDTGQRVKSMKDLLKKLGSVYK